MLTQQFLPKRAPKVQGFIFNWKGHESGAFILKKKLDKLIKTTVINSDEQLTGKYPDWVHLDDTAYFAAQWNEAIGLFEGDIFFHVQADAEFDQFDDLIAKAVILFEKYKLGVYEPNVDHTDIKYERSKLKSIDADLFEVPFTDCTCWFIAGNLIHKLPPVDTSINKYGWGIPRAIASLCKLNKQLCVRDYSFTVVHPKSRGYSSAAALRQLELYIQSLDPSVREGLLRLQQHRALLRPISIRRP